VFTCWCGSRPKDIPDAVAQASGAAARAAIPMVKGEVEIEPIVAVVDSDVCGGCEVCLELCPFGAIERKDEKATINVALCKGCGTCVGACPSGALDQQHFRTNQIFAQIEAALNESK
jgi:heterodisulfide reductase subunit A